MNLSVKSENPLFEIARENLMASLDLLQRENDLNRIGSSAWTMAKNIARASIEFLETETDKGWTYIERPKDGV
jgi:hypothetical protein